MTDDLQIKRELIAAICLHALLPAWDPEIGPVTSYMPRLAVTLADALLAELAKEQTACTCPMDVRDHLAGCPEFDRHQRSKQP